MQRELVWLVTVLLNALKISWKARLSSMQSNPFGRLKILLAFHLGSLHCTVLNPGLNLHWKKRPDQI